MHKVSSKVLMKLAKNEINEMPIKIGILDGKDINMMVKLSLSMSDFVKFVGEMSEAQFTEIDNEAKFRPQHGSILFDIALCEYYSNINLPEDISESFEIINKLGLKEKILSVVGSLEQYNTLVKNIADAQEFEIFRRINIEEAETMHKD